MKNLVAFTGAGISAESGIRTFRDSDGLWENHDISEVATPEAWKKNPKLVLEFYNMRRKQVIESSPNDSHLALPLLEEEYEVNIITQNIDDLHERAGSSNILHLHGELLKSRCQENDDEKYNVVGAELNYGNNCPDGHQLRPDVVWFGEAVPNMINAIKICEKADYFIIIGTSLNVYPAANLIDYVPKHCKNFLIDPKDVFIPPQVRIKHMKEKASKGVPDLVNLLLSRSI